MGAASIFIYSSRHNEILEITKRKLPSRSDKGSYLPYSESSRAVRTGSCRQYCGDKHYILVDNSWPMAATPFPLSSC